MVAQIDWGRCAGRAGRKKETLRGWASACDDVSAVRRNNAQALQAVMAVESRSAQGCAVGLAYGETRAALRAVGLEPLGIEREYHVTFRLVGAGAVVGKRAVDAVGEQDAAKSRIGAFREREVKGDAFPLVEIGMVAVAVDTVGVPHAGVTEVNVDVEGRDAGCLHPFAGGESDESGEKEQQIAQECFHFMLILSGNRGRRMLALAKRESPELARPDSLLFAKLRIFCFPAITGNEKKQPL